MAKEIKESVESIPKELRLCLDNINKKYGAGSAMMSNEKPAIDLEVVSSGSLGLDVALGVGGYPRGRIIEIYGAESGGKTTMALHAIAECQKEGNLCAFVDAEHALDIYYAQALGVKTDKLVISQPDNGEQALEIVESLVSSGKMGTVVVDSVAALTPRSEIEGEMGDSKVGIHARLMSQAMRKLVSIVSRTNTLLIFINQTREKIGVMFGSPITTTGGNALKFYASIRIDVSKTGQNKGTGVESDIAVGNKTRVKVVKNKVSPPFRVAEFDIIFGKGISYFGEVLDLGVVNDIIKKAGAYYSYSDTKLGQGRDAVIALLADNPELCDEISTQVKIKAGLIKL